MLFNHCSFIISLSFIQVLFSNSSGEQYLNSQVLLEDTYIGLSFSLQVFFDDFIYNKIKISLKKVIKLFPNFICILFIKSYIYFYYFY